MNSQTTLRKKEADVYNRLAKEVVKSGQAWAAINQTMEGQFPRLKGFRRWYLPKATKEGVTA